MYPSVARSRYLPDLRHFNEGQPEKYQVFWENCKEDCLAVDECRHGETTHLACAMSVRDLDNGLDDSLA